MNEAYFEVRSSKNKYYLTYTLSALYLGGKRKDCVSVQRNYYPMMEDINDKQDYAKLVLVQNKTECVLDYIGNNSKSTGLDLMMTSLFFLKRADRKRYIDFEDASYVLCTDDSTQLSLSSYYIVYYGKTWYDYYFGAKLVDNDIRDKYESGLQRLTDWKAKVSVEVFKDFLEIHKIENVDEMTELYNKTQTYKEFFRVLKQKFGSKQELCLFLRKFLDEFVRTFLNIRFGWNIWRIDLHNLDVENYITLDNIKQVKKPKFLDLTNQTGGAIIYGNHEFTIDDL